jgi:SAM-dependent methyltransferase
MLDLDRQNAYRRRYAREHPGWQDSGPIYEAAARRHVRPDTRLLDLGCGRGGLVELLRSEVALAVGVDPDLRSLLEHRAPALLRVAARAEALPFAGESFDLVISSWVLEHLAAPEPAMIEVARVLSPGGCFVFLTPNAHSLPALLNRVLGRIGRLQAWLVARLYGRAEVNTFPVVYRANTARTLHRLAQKAGFRCRELIFVGDPTYFAFNELLYRLSCGLEALTPHGMKVHLVGTWLKPAGGGAGQTVRP